MVEGTRLESVRARKGLESSNLSLSANPIFSGSLETPAPPVERAPNSGCRTFRNPGNNPAQMKYDAEKTQSGAEEFRMATAGDQVGLLREFAEFLRFNKKFWMIPLLLSLLGLSVLIMLGGSSAALFIYPIF